MKKAVFTIFFMLGITAIFVFALAGINEVSRDRIAENQLIDRVRSIMYACNILPDGVYEYDLPPTTKTSDIPWDDQRILAMISARMEAVNFPITPAHKVLLQNSYLMLQDSVEIHIILDNNNLISGYGFYLRGKGLWGTIGAYAAITEDLTSLMGIDFTFPIQSASAVSQESPVP